MITRYQQWVCDLTGDTTLTDFTVIQSLWSDYGIIARFFSAKLNQHLVAKVIAPSPSHKHPRGWQGKASHNRKCQSYEVEATFYNHFSAGLPAQCRTADVIKTGSFEDHSVILLEDLDKSGFHIRHHYIPPEDCDGVLAWLAYFHAAGINNTFPGLWSQGTYWHLGTREEEFQSMPQSPLKDYAARIDNALASCPFQTWVHGDAKIANFCFTDTPQQVAAVDFQYVGPGIGVKDVQYFLGSVFNNRELEIFTTALLNRYFAFLKQALIENGKGAIADHVCHCWREYYPLAVADFNRFLAGWNPSHQKRNSEMEHQTVKAMSWIDNHSL